MFQQIINIIYRYPKSEFHKFKRFGGYLKYRNMIRWSERMKAHSMDLPPVQSHADGLPIYFLTGKGYLYQTLYCIQSLVKHCDEKFRFILVDDGSFDNDLMNRMNRQLPGAIIVAQAEITDNLQSTLPENTYVYLNHKRKVYQHIKKLTDIHTIPGKPWKLVLDSDMLFWDEPTQLINWLKEPSQPLHMIDCNDSYGYSKQLMEYLCGCTIRPLINVGAIGLNSTAIDWNKVEFWVKELEEQEGKTYYLEQALSAMLIGAVGSTVLDSGQYIVNPVSDSLGILHHYVDLSKEIYFTKAWLRV